MSARRGATGLSGILLVDKPVGFTSHDVVGVVRRVTGERRVGHAGTLDPMATGLLVVLIGPATRLEPYLSSESKAYDARVSFGFATDTDDAEGEPVRHAEVRAELFEPDVAKRALAALLGESMQMPPAYSAIKVGGRVAHKAARSGQPLELAPRHIRVDEARLLGVDADAAAWDVAFRVSKGTYIRSLARDLGERAGTAAHLSSLRRTASGRLLIEDAHTVGQIEHAGAGGVSALFTDPIDALGLVELPAAHDDVANGRPITGALDVVADGERVGVTDDGRLAALYRRAGDCFVPDVVLATPIARVR